jgi:hypothetical protein
MTPRLTPFRVSLTDEEVEAFLYLMETLGCATPDKLIRLALWNQGRQSQVDLPTDCFLRVPSGRITVQPAAAPAARPGPPPDRPDPPG